MGEGGKSAYVKLGERKENMLHHHHGGAA